MSVKLAYETSLEINEADLLAILTDHFCSGSYGAFADLQATIVNEKADGRFNIVFEPKPQKEAE